MIDNIEHNVSKTVEYVGDAAVQVHEAHVNHRAAMKVSGTRRTLTIDVLVFAEENNHRRDSNRRRAHLSAHLLGVRDDATEAVRKITTSVY